MSGFQDMVDSDIDLVFLNLDEFAQMHHVEGNRIPVVLDDDELNSLKQGQMLGIVEADLLMMGRVSDFPRNMNPGRLINVDGREMIVVDAKRDMGLIEAALKQNRTG